MAAYIVLSEFKDVKSKTLAGSTMAMKHFSQFYIKKGFKTINLEVLKKSPALILQSEEAEFKRQTCNKYLGVLQAMAKCIFGYDLRLKVELEEVIQP